MTLLFSTASKTLQTNEAKSAHSDRGAAGNFLRSRLCLSLCGRGLFWSLGRIRG